MPKQIRNGKKQSPEVGAGSFNYTLDGQTVNRRKNIVANRKTQNFLMSFSDRRDLHTRER